MVKPPYARFAPSDPLGAKMADEHGWLLGTALLEVSVQGGVDVPFPTVLAVVAVSPLAGATESVQPPPSGAEGGLRDWLTVLAVA
jgi:hypothetical protein